MHREEQGRAHRQNFLMQQLQNCCFGQDDEHFGEPQSVSMDMDLEETESEKQKLQKMNNCTPKYRKARKLLLLSKWSSYLNISWQ